MTVLMSGMKPLLFLNVDQNLLFWSEKLGNHTSCLVSLRTTAIPNILTTFSRDISYFTLLFLGAFSSCIVLSSWPKASWSAVLFADVPIPIPAHAHMLNPFRTGVNSLPVNHFSWRLWAVYLYFLIRLHLLRVLAASHQVLVESSAQLNPVNPFIVWPDMDSTSPEWSTHAKTPHSALRKLKSEQDTAGR